jgi:hypothetical protein
MSGMTAVRLIIAIVLTPVCGYLAVIFGTYGALGVYYAFKQHESWTEAGILYLMLSWMLELMLLLIGILCTAVVVGAWIFVFTRRNPVRLNSHPNPLPPKAGI